MKPPFTGLIAAPFTPFTAEGALALDTIERQAERLSRYGVRGAFVCGTTGEGLSMSVDERQAVAQRWRDVAGEELAVIVHVTALALPEARALAAHAEAIGADAIGVMAPPFFKPANATALADWCGQIAAAAPATPLYYYHIPSMSGYSQPVYDLLAAAETRVPTLAGVKFTYENLMDFARCLAFGSGRYDMLFGRDEILLAGLSLGARGAVGSTYNFAAPIYGQVIKAFNAGDLSAARAAQARAVQMVAVMARYGGGVTAGKAIMSLIGLDCGPVRCPLTDTSASARRTLETELEQAGFFEFAMKA